MVFGNQSRSSVLLLALIFCAVGGCHGKSVAGHASMEQDALLSMIAGNADGTRYLQRQLQPSTTTVTDFCLTQMAVIQAHHTQAFYEIFPPDVTTVATESGGYDCGCTRSSDDKGALRVICDLVFFLSDEGNSPQTNREVLQFTPFESNILPEARPERTGWAQREGDLTFRETFDFNTTTLLDLLEFESCNVDYGSYCDVDQPTCSICDGGQAVSLSGVCSADFTPNTICDEGYQGSFFNTWLIDNNIVTVEDDRALLDCDNIDNNVPTVEAFCGNLTTVEATLMEAFMDYIERETFNFTIYDPFQCACSDDDSSENFTVACLSSYTDFDDDVTVNHSNSEIMQFEREGNYIVMRSAEWCDGPIGEEVYCEEYKFCIGQSSLCSCNIDGCNADYCEICADNRSIGFICEQDNIPALCNETLTGAFAFALKDLQFLPPACETTDTPVEMPTNSPTDAPVRMPLNATTTPTSSPSMVTTNPTEDSGVTDTPTLTPMTNGPTLSPSLASAGSIANLPLAVPTGLFAVMLWSNILCY